MKFFVCFALLIVAAAANPAGPSPSNVNSGVSVQEANEGEAQPVQPLASELTRLRKSAYGGSSGGYGGGASIPAPPCPKNYIISCQPNLAPVACSSPASSSSSYGSAGAYSAPIPTFVAQHVLPNNGYGLPQPIAYGNQYYQY